MMQMQKNNFGRLLSLFTETFGLGRAAAVGAILLIGLATLLAIFLFLKSAPPTTLVITSGPKGSLFQTNAEMYRLIMARNGVTLRVLPSHGSLENLERLQSSSLRVDVCFGQGGVTNGSALEKLVSLGSIAYQPLLVFYRGTTTVELLSGLKGKKLAIGPVGSGTHTLALALLAANGIEPGGATSLVDLDGGSAAQALLAGSVDAAFLMGVPASAQTRRQLLRAADLHLLSFAQAD